FAPLGYTGDVAANGREALFRWRSGSYGLLLSDLHMPEMDGYELMQATRREEGGGRRIPILALTANAVKGEADRCREVGMDDYRSKPVPLAELKAVLEKWLPSSTGKPVVASPAIGSAGANIITTALDVSILKGLVGEDPELVREFL